MTMRKEKPGITCSPQVYCWSRKELSALPSCPEGNRKPILTPKNGWAPAARSAGTMGPAVVFCG